MYKKLPTLVLHHIRIQLYFLQRNGQQVVLGLETIRRIGIWVCHSIYFECRNFFTLISQYRFCIAPTNKVLEAYTLHTKFQTLFFLHIVKGNTGERCQLGTFAYLVDYATALSLLPPITCASAANSSTSA